MKVAVSDPEKNLEKGEKLVKEAVRKKSNIICFPEMWTTGFNWAKNEDMAWEHEKIIERIADMASRYSIWISGSVLALNENSRLSNTAILFDPKGKKAGEYRKAHLFSFIGEDKHMEPGRSLCVADTPWGLTGLTVCYDIRFPELFRTYALKGVKMIFSPMAFPHPKIQHWKILVRARAIENQMFIIGTNQVGSETLSENGTISYFGDSVIIDPWGETVVEASQTKEELVTAVIDTALVDEIRNKMKVLKDRRPDLYEL